MACHKVDALFRLPLLMRVQVRTGQEARCDLGPRAPVASNKASDIVPALSIPLFPGIADETPNLVQTCGIPESMNTLVLTWEKASQINSKKISLSLSCVRSGKASADCSYSTIYFLTVDLETLYVLAS